MFQLFRRRFPKPLRRHQQTLVEAVDELLALKEKTELHQDAFLQHFPDESAKRIRAFLAQ